MLRGIPFYNLRGPDLQGTKKFVAAQTLDSLRKGETITVDKLQETLKYIATSPWLVRGFKGKITSLANVSPETHICRKDLDGGFTPALWAKIENNQFLDSLQLERKEKALIKTMIEKGEDIRFTLGTIHSVKGREVDWVIMLSDMSFRTYTNYISERESEQRVWYVGVTRARMGVYIVDPQGVNYFRFPKINKLTNSPR